MCTIRVLQANLHHTKGASATLSKRFAEENITIGLIQEPWVICGQIKVLRNRSSKLIFKCGELIPRAACLISTNINFLPIPE